MGLHFVTLVLLALNSNVSLKKCAKDNAHKLFMMYTVYYAINRIILAAFKKTGLNRL